MPGNSGEAAAGVAVFSPVPARAAKSPPAPDRRPHSPAVARTLIFIPAWNEEESIVAVVEGLRRELPEADLLVVDDGSADLTAARARAAGAMVASHPVNQGLGASLQTGYRFALRHDYEVVAHCDADGQHPPAEVRRLVEAVSAGECDLALGSRFLEPDRGLADPELYRPSGARTIGIAVFRSLLTLATGQRFTDATSGLRAANRRVIDLFADRYGADYPELESLTRAVRAGLVVRELPVVMHLRTAGASKITPIKSVFWVFNGVLSLLAASLRPRMGKAG